MTQESEGELMCPGMTDLSPDSTSDPGAEIEEEDEPEGESIETQYCTGAEAMGSQTTQHVDEQDGYFTSSTLPGRSLHTDVAQTTQSDGHEPESDHESEDGETASQMRHKYLQSGLDEVSDPEYQELHHFDSEPESDDSNNADIDFNLNVECMSFVGVFYETI